MSKEVEQALSTADIEYERHGDEYWARCPQHKKRTGKPDRNPSWSISAKGLHYCFSCHYSGNLYTLIRDLMGVGAAKSYRAEVETFGRSGEVDTKSAKAKAEGWVHSRKRVKEPGIPEVYLAMFNPVVPEWALTDRDISADAAEVYEVLWDDEDAWILPFWHPTGHLIGWQVKNAHGRGFKNHPPGLAKGSTLFGYGVVEKESTIMVVESPLDAVKLFGLGYPSVALAGSKATKQQEALLGGFDRLVLALDNDAAGLNERSRLKSLFPMSAMPKYTDLGDRYKDPGEMPDVIIDSLFARYFV
jgi:hypothetical protein